MPDYAAEHPLAAITKELGYAYRQEKDAKTRKDKERVRFFEQIDRDLRDDDQAERLADVEGDVGQDDLVAVVAERYPAWRMDDHRWAEDHWEVILVERVEFRPFTYVNVIDGWVYVRQIVSGAPMLDIERLKREDQALYDAATHVPEPERVMRPMDDLTPTQVAALQDYIYEGKPTVKLVPRKAKPEELEDAES